jgi:MoxR-vWA-beta-propeller ternary system domain bpX5
MGMSSERVPVRWSSRAEPLEPLAVAGEGDVARALARRLLSETDARLAEWSGVAGEGVLVLLGPSGSLPWVDGAVYLGRDSAAPSLLMPCALAPNVAASMLERALLARVGNAGTPVAVLPASGHLVPVGAARPVSRVTLTAWLEPAPVATNAQVLP